MADKIVSVKSVELDYPLYSVNARSLRSVAALAIGGTLMRSRSDSDLYVRALHGITFDLVSGDRLAVMGANGSGKSTLLRVLAGIYEPTRGQVRVNGKISSLLEIGAGLDPEATGARNILLLASLLGHVRPEILERQRPAAPSASSRVAAAPGRVAAARLRASCRRTRTGKRAEQGCSSAAKISEAIYPIL